MNQLFLMIKKYNESKGTLISSLIMWLLFLSFSNRNFSFPQFSAAFETQFSLLNTLPIEVVLCTIIFIFTCFFSYGKVFNILSRALEVETAEIAHWDRAFIWFRNAKEKWPNCLLFYVLFISRCQLFISLLSLN